MYGLRQAVMIANKILIERLPNHVYRPCEITPGLWNHNTNPVIFCLTVDDFGVKYVGKEHVTHIIYALQHYYKIAID